MPTTKFTLSFGLTTVPVRIENLHNDGSKPKGSYVCATSKTKITTTSGGGFSKCEQAHGGACERATGYDRGDGTFFVPSDDTLTALKAVKDGAISLTKFVPEDEVSPVFYDKTYIVKPDTSSEQALRVFWLVAGRLAKLKRIAVGSFVMDKDEKMVFLRYDRVLDAMVLQTGVFDEQIKYSALREAQSTRVAKFSAAETTLMDQIMKDVYVGPFVPTEIKPTRWHALNELIAGAKVEQLDHEPLPEIESLQDKLAATIAAKQAEKKTPNKKAAAK